jgi:aryl-alcohol dehydrogenase-like predicted oxidoreductase
LRYKLLGHSGLRVSEMCLGTMTFGEVWGWGASKEESRKIFDCFVDQGGNFIDTANNYTDGTSEQYVGDFIASDRGHFVVATKYTLSTRKDDPNGGGNHRKNMVQALEASLKRLCTDYIDLYWLHMWDFLTPVEEIMRALDHLVRAGKVLYIGVSDTPAWIVSQANTLAEWRGWSQFVGLQVPYCINSRDVERDLLPMARAFDMAVLAWAPLSGGELTGKYRRPNDTPRRYGDEPVSEHTQTCAEAVIQIAAEIGRTPAQVAINWVRQQQDRALIIPIVGARTEAQMRENLGCLEFALTSDHLRRLDEISKIKSGFPHSFLASEEVQGLIYGNTLPLIDRHR